MIAGWSPGIGDPTPLGWVTVIAYLAACVATLRAFRRDVSANAAIWLGISILLGLLAINKQLDLQTLLTALARAAAKSDGWYENRRIVQKEFILSLLAVSGAVTLGLLYLTRVRGRALHTAILGVSFLILFVCVRAISFHNMDTFIGLSFLGVTANHILEITGITLTGIGALMVRQSSNPRRRALNRPG